MTPIMLRRTLLSLILLMGVATAAAQMPHDHSAMGHSQGSMNMTTATAPGCVGNPMTDSCKDYEYPLADVVQDLDALCNAMPFMTACSVRDACKSQSPASALGYSNDICDGFRLLATTCVHDTGMSGMKGCASYNTLCAAGTKVKICSMHAPITFVPPTRTLNTKVQSICKEMTMDGCEKCTPSWDKGQMFGNCSLLDVYSQLCTAMPTMGQCDDWSSMCKADASFYACPGGKIPGGGGNTPSKKAPVMKMYFNSERPFYLLFAEWTPTTNSEYIGAWFAIFFLGIIFEAVQVLRHVYDTKLYCYSVVPSKKLNNSCSRCDTVNEAGSSDVGGSCCGGHGTIEPNGTHEMQHSMLPSSQMQVKVVKGSDVLHDGNTVAGLIPTRGGKHFVTYPRWLQVAVLDLGRAALLFCSVVMAYGLMLAAMSFNVGIFFAVCGGIAFGSLLLGRFRLSPAAVCSTDECCLV